LSDFSCMSTSKCFGKFCINLFEFYRIQQKI
jgi:hypothetical protein